MAAPAFMTASWILLPVRNRNLLTSAIGYEVNIMAHYSGLYEFPFKNGRRVIPQHLSELIASLDCDMWSRLFRWRQMNAF